jgi:predicted RND superfamily exporter protein
MSDRIAALILRYRLAVLIGVLLTSLASLAVLGDLKFDFTPQALFAGREDLVDFNEEVKETFGHSENVVIVVLHAVGEDDLLTPRALSWQRRLCARLQTHDFVQRVDALATLRLPRMRLFGGLLAGSPVAMVPVVRTGPIDEDSSQLVRRKVAGQPLMEGVLISHDRRATAIALQLDPTRKDIQHVTRVINSIRETLSQEPPPRGYAAFLGGLPAMRVEIIASLIRDQTTIIPLCVVMFALIQLLLFRCLSGVLVPAVAVGVGLAWTMAILVQLDQSITIISNILPVLLMIVGMSSSVHFLSAYAEQMAHGTLDRRQAVRAAAAHMIPACLLTSLTTALGFLSLMLARSTLLGGLGWQAALGIGLFYLATVLICTAWLPSFRAPAHRGTTTDRTSVLTRLAVLAGTLATRHPQTVVSAGIIAVAVAAALGSHIVIDSQLIETYDQEHVEVARMRLIEDQLAGFVPLEVIVRGSSPDWYLEPEAWVKLREFADHARAQPEVLLVRSLVDLLDQADKLRPGGTPLSELTLADPQKLADRLTLLTRGLERFPAANRLALRQFVAQDERTVRFAIRLRDEGARGNLRLASCLYDNLKRLFPSSSGARVRITGESYVAAVAMTGFIRDLLISLLGVSLLIFLVIGTLFRSLRLGLITVLPNMAPLLLTVGYLVLRGYPLNVGNVIVFAISLGIAVDDSIHFLARFRQEILRTTDIDRAIEKTCEGTGRAIVLTTLLIVSGLAILLFSAFVPTRRFAELAAVTMVSALAGDLLLLPALLKLFWRDARPHATRALDTAPRPLAVSGNP